MLRFLCAAALASCTLALLSGRAAHADAEEAALHLEFAPSVARESDPRASGTATLPAARLTLRGTYGLTNTWAFEISLGGSFGAGATLDGVALGQGRTGELLQNAHVGRLTTGLTARLGVRWIPTLTLHVGYQHRFLPDAARRDPASATIVNPPAPGQGLDDVLIIAGVGLDYRASAHVIAGVSIQAVHAFSFDGVDYDAVEIPLSIAWYWYPRW